MITCPEALTQIQQIHKTFISYFRFWGFKVFGGLGFLRFWGLEVFEGFLRFLEVFGGF